MDVTVRFGSGITLQDGVKRLSVTVPENATVGELISAIARQYPELTTRLDSALPVISGRHAARTERLIPGQEVSFLLPVAGG